MPEGEETKFAQPCLKDKWFVGDELFYYDMPIINDRDLNLDLCSPNDVEFKEFIHGHFGLTLIINLAVSINRNSSCHLLSTRRQFRNTSLYYNDIIYIIIYYIYRYSVPIYLLSVSVDNTMSIINDKNLKNILKPIKINKNQKVIGRIDYT